MQVDHVAVRKVMDLWFSILKAKHATNADSPEDFYGFDASDVITLYEYKLGTGRGLWFRLADGRVFDSAGRYSHHEDEWYATRLH